MLYTNNAQETHLDPERLRRISDMHWAMITVPNLYAVPVARWVIRPSTRRIAQGRYAWGRMKANSC